MEEKERRGGVCVLLDGKFGGFEEREREKEGNLFKSSWNHHHRQVVGWRFLFSNVDVLIGLPNCPNCPKFKKQIDDPLSSCLVFVLCCLFSWRDLMD